MTTHLEETRLVEIAERGETHPHIAACPRCAAQVEEMRALLGAVAAADVPEPSPLFWEHFAARVAGAVKAEPRALRRAGWTWSDTAWRRAALVAAVLVVAAIVSWRSGVLAPEPLPAPESPFASVAGPRGAAAGVDTAIDDDAWELVTDAGAGMDLQAAADAGFDIPPGAAELAAAQLSPDEQRELVRLLRAAVAQRQ